MLEVTKQGAYFRDSVIPYGGSLTVISDGDELGGVDYAWKCSVKVLYLQ